jgi:hypothetical protein
VFDNAASIKKSRTLSRRRLTLQVNCDCSDLSKDLAAAEYPPIHAHKLNSPAVVIVRVAAGNKKQVSFLREAIDGYICECPCFLAASPCDHNEIRMRSVWHEMKLQRTEL